MHAMPGCIYDLFMATRAYQDIPRCRSHMCTSDIHRSVQGRVTYAMRLDKRPFAAPSTQRHGKRLARLGSAAAGLQTWCR